MPKASLFAATKCATSSPKTRKQREKRSVPLPTRSRRSDDADIVYSFSLGWESCARRIVIGLEHIVRADRARKPIDAEKVGILSNLARRRAYRVFDSSSVTRVLEHFISKAALRDNKLME